MQKNTGIDGLNKILELARDYLISRVVIIRHLDAIVGFLESHKKNLEKEWKEHLEGEHGSCYCMASDDSCIPERIKEIDMILCGIKAGDEKVYKEGKPTK